MFGFVFSFLLVANCKTKSKFPGGKVGIMKYLERIYIPLF